LGVGSQTLLPEIKYNPDANPLRRILSPAVQLNAVAMNANIGVTMADDRTEDKSEDSAINDISLY